MQVQSLSQEDTLEKEMAIYFFSSILAWEIPWTEEPGRLQSHGVATSQAQLSTHASRCNSESSLQVFSAR